MKLFTVCLNPKCNVLFHEVKLEKSEVMYQANIPFICINDGSEDALLTPDLYIKMAEMALEDVPSEEIIKLGSAKIEEVRKTFEGDQTVSEPTPVTAVQGHDPYYSSQEYVDHQKRLAKLTEDKYVADITLTKAKARLTSAEAQKILANLPPSKV